MTDLSAELDSTTNEITIVSDTGADILLAGMSGDVWPLTLGVDGLPRPPVPAVAQVMVNTDYYVYSGEVSIEVEDGVTVTDIAGVDGYWGGLVPVIYATFDPSDPDSYNWSTAVAIFDSLGEEHLLSLYFIKQRTDPLDVESSANSWQVYVQIDGENVGNPLQGSGIPSPVAFNLQFGADGTLLSVSDVQLAITNWLPLDENGNYNGALSPDNQSVPPFGPIPTSSNFVIEVSGSTQFSGPFAEYSNEQNGYPAGDAFQHNLSEIYVLYGAEQISDTTLSPTELNGSNGFVIRQFGEGDADTPYASSELSVTSAGDVNGDGLADLLIAPVEGFNPFDPTAKYDDQFYLVYGQDGTHPATVSLDSLSDQGTAFSMGWIHDDFWQVSTLGDVNGDGYDDIAASTDSTSYLVFGRENGLGEQVEIAQLHPNEGVLFEHVSEPLRPAGDLNDDGYDDIVAVDVLGVAHIIYGEDQFF